MRVRSGTNLLTIFSRFLLEAPLISSSSFMEPLIRVSSFCHEVVFSKVLALFYPCSMRCSSYGIVSLQGRQLRGAYLCTATQFTCTMLAHKYLSRGGPISFTFCEANPCATLLFPLDFSCPRGSVSLLVAVARPDHPLMWSSLFCPFIPTRKSSIGASWR